MNNPFITITPTSTLTRSGCNCLGSNMGLKESSNLLLGIIITIKYNY